MLSLGQELLYGDLHPCWSTLTPKQVDLSMLFPEPSVSDGHPWTSMLAFLSGEKRQAVCTSTTIPPVKIVEKVNWEYNHIQLQNCLYVTFCLCYATELTPSRSKYSIDLSKDLDDTAVSLLIKHGLGKRFPDPCSAWKAQNFESGRITQKTIAEKKQFVDAQLKNDQPQLDDTLARGIVKEILNTYWYVLLQFSPVK